VSAVLQERSAMAFNISFTFQLALRCLARPARHRAQRRPARNPTPQERGLQQQAVGARRAGAPAATAAAAALMVMTAAHATTPLADQPLFSNAGVPGNLALTLSVEFPTAVSQAHTDDQYNKNKAYLGYFDHRKCYRYSWNSNESLRHFFPQGKVNDSNECAGGSLDSTWSGNFLNWATMQTIDPFRWALTGGYRSVDTTSLTLLEKAWASGQGGSGNFSNRRITSQTVGATPFAWNEMRMRIHGLGNKMRFTQFGNVDGTPTEYNPANGVEGGKTYEVSVRVKVCDPSEGAGPMEPNCKAYPAGTFKPTGLIQQYADKIRYSVFSYLNDSNKERDGGVMRARQKFVGPAYTLPGQLQTLNANSEWDANTGIFFTDPDAGDSAATATALGVPIKNSGVINYLNKFGQITQGNYKSFDNVSELYYAALRYFRALGNVPEWSAMGGANNSTKAAWADGFPVITNWDDPILYACQSNFVLGIGDVNTWLDKNVPGNTGTLGEPSKPSAVVADTSVDAKRATDKVGALHGLGSNLGSATNGQSIPGSFYIAGLAYDANATDIRPDTPGKPQTVGKQSVQTYWLDVLEFRNYVPNNMYYLATKYGGAKLPASFDPYARTTDLPLQWWNTTGETLFNQSKPDNYFVAQKADEMISGLTRAFTSISDNLRAYTTSFSTLLPQINATGTTSFSAQYDPGTWTGELAAEAVTLDPTSTKLVKEPVWNFSTKLNSQASGAGWDTARRIVTWNTETNRGVPFRHDRISAAQRAALDTAYRSGDDSADYLNYLRGQTLHEESSGAANSAAAYRNRTRLLGDIVGSKPRVVGRPMALLSPSSNPGYGDFKNTWASRKTMVYVGSNSGMLHAVDAALTGPDAGREVFAYVPGALYQGPTGTPQTNGLASRGKPELVHRYLVDAAPSVFDIDLGRTPGGSGTDWRSVLVGGLGKGGKAYYALDVTNPGGIDTASAASSTEASVAARVMWEFTDPDLGYTYGEPAAVKTRQHGWVLIFGSGYNNSDGRGYFFIVNPRDGSLIQKISTGAGLPAAQAGLAHVQAFVQDRSDNTADSVYAGDLLGNLWRLDLRNAAGAYAAPVKLATLADSNNQAQPITSRPNIVVQPGTLKRWVTVGTGRLLDASDVSSSQSQALYAIQDGTTLGFNVTPPAGFNFPLTANSLKQLTDLTQPVALNNNQLGWYVDLGNNSTGPGWRVISDPSSFFGSVEFTATLPGGNTCRPNGTSRVYSINLGTGQSDLLAANGSGFIAYSTAVEGVVTEQRSYGLAVGDMIKRVLVAGNSSTGEPTFIHTRQPGSPGLRRVNWRELPLAN
jgi:type IV pilus assembly protein PilY1